MNQIVKFILLEQKVIPLFILYLFLFTNIILADLIKTESDRIVSSKTMRDFAKEIDAVEVFETSSKEGVGIKEIFEHICQNYNVNTHQQSNQSSTSVSITSNHKPQTKSSCCS